MTRSYLSSLLVLASQKFSHGFIPSPLSSLSTSKTHHDPTSYQSSQIFLDGEGMAGKTLNKHLLGDILRSLQPKYLNQMKDSLTQNMKGATKLDLNAFTTFEKSLQKPPPSWDILSKMLQNQQSSKEQSFRALLENGTIHSGLSSNSIRINPQHPNPNVKITFYKDTASWCPYCQKVWIALEEKKLSYTIQKVDMNCYAGGSKPTNFLEVQPSGNLPCIVVEDLETNQVEIYNESNDFLEYIDSLSNGSNVPTLYPPDKDSKDYEQMVYLCQDGRNSLERRLFAEWMWYLTGVRKPKEYRERYESMLDEVNEVLSESNGPYFMGKHFSIVDIQFLPFIERQMASLAYFKGMIVRDETKWPNLVKWIKTMEQRDSYQSTKSDYYTHSRSLPPQLSGGCSFYDGCEEVRDSIDVYSQPFHYYSDQNEADLKSWLEWTEPGWDSISTNESKREAAERIIHNHENLIRFACRAVGTPGLPAAAAPLADPKAISNTDATQVIDFLMRHAVHSLLSSSHDKLRKDLDWGLEDIGIALSTNKEGKHENQDTLEGIAKCLDYIRSRVGVPRDMSYPASKELKKELLRISSSMMKLSIPTISSNNEKMSEKVL